MSRITDTIRDIMWAVGITLLASAAIVVSGMALAHWVATVANRLNTV